MGWRCGTFAGYEDHRRAGEETCQPCRDANTARMKAYRKKKGRTVGDDLYTRARSRAMAQLIEAHPEEWKRLLYAAKLAERRGHE